jgi:hypothetical protein
MEELNIETYLALVTTELPMAVHKSLQANAELCITAAHDVLSLELKEIHVKPKFLNDPHVLTRSYLARGVLRPKHGTRAAAIVFKSSRQLRSTVVMMLGSVGTIPSISMKMQV